MSVQRVALIYDDQARPETTGGYCLRALKGLVDVEHFLPGELERVPRYGVDLYLNIDDGLRYTLPRELHPSAWWAIDTHLDFQGCLAKAHDFDFVFAAQRDGAAQLRDEGISTTWLPLACDPDIHRKHEGEKQFDVCFVGNIFPGPRAELLDLLQRRFRNMLVGQRYFEDMARTYSASRVVFNRSIANDVNMRVFEALACGSLLVTNDLRDNGQAEMFQDGTHLATYQGAEELVDKIQFYLVQDVARERIASAGRAEVLARHTYLHRMKQLLEKVDRRPLVERVTANPSRSEGPTLRLKVREPGADAAQIIYDTSYFDFARPELLALVPESARRVLDIGCGAGRLGEAIKARQTAEVVGIEMVEAAARRARERLDQVLVGNVERMDLPFESGSFDAVICGDVLEHLRDPEGLLRRVRTLLRPGGCVIASIPNVRHHTVVRSLLAGNWTYEPAGLLDRTHLRFFTRVDIEQLFAETGFTITRLGMVPGAGYEEWQQQGRPGEINVGGLHASGMPADEVEEFYVYQYLVTAVPIPAAGKETGPEERGSSLAPPLGRGEEEGVVAPCFVRVGHNGKLRILYLGDFGSSWRHETQAANALQEQQHEVTRLHEYRAPSARDVLSELNSGRYDCLLFYKGRINARTMAEVFEPTGEAIAEVLQRTKVPGYTWYVDRAYQFALQPSREAWMRRVAPLCRAAFVADTALTQMPWARWHILREPISRSHVRQWDIPEAEREQVGFIGQLYGSRQEELAAVEAAFPLRIISGVYGAALSPVIQSYKIILGPRYPTVPGFWGNRVYVVLGHGGFFLAPEVPGMSAEGILPGVHYAPLGPDPVADIRAWLERPEERGRIARAGQELVLSRFTYEHAVGELCRVIGETL
jgi:2-polyprenyl-3-methyl-5-hydroxy-6-metoxy-1,4-benzoquinol methylase